MLIFRIVPKYIVKSAKNNGILSCTNIKNSHIRLVNHAATSYGQETDPAPVFFNTEVQSLLKSLTRIDLAKVYRKRQLGGKTLAQPVYKFMTDEQLQETIAEAQKKVDVLLQIPPVVKVRKPIDRVLTHDPALQGLETTSKFIFTDVTFGTKDIDRLIVIREPNGTLREADWDVRDRINQMYFPKTSRTLKVPLMFKEEYLESLLSRKKYEFVLDRACCQFEPDHPDYQRVVHTTYEHINSNQEFQLLRSTRHFGSMVFYLVWFNKIDNLLLELIETSYIDEANSLLKLYGKLHNIEFSSTENYNLQNIVKYIKEIAQKKGPLELAFQAYKDLEKQRQELERGINAAHGFV